MVPTVARQLIAFEFPPGSQYEGRLVGALERIESGGAVRIVDGLFVGRDGGSGELFAVSLRSEGGGGMIGRLIAFRLEAGARAKATERTLAGPRGAAIRALAQSLEPGAAAAALMIEHSWAGALSEAITRMGGSQIASRNLDAEAAVELPDELASIVSPAVPPAP